MTDSSRFSGAFAALGHDTRLDIFRLLVKAGPNGLTVGETGQKLGLAPSTLAHHLSALVDEGLVIKEKQGREAINKANFAAMLRLVNFLTAECCAGFSDETRPGNC